MTEAPSPITPDQLTLLKWIGEGEPVRNAEYLDAEGRVTRDPQLFVEARLCKRKGAGLISTRVLAEELAALAPYLCGWSLTGTGRALVFPVASRKRRAA